MDKNEKNRRATLAGKPSMPFRAAPLSSLAQPAARAAIALSLLAVASVQAAGDYPITAEQRSTANQVAQAGVPLSELAPDAPDTYTVKRGDTLWDISKIFLRSPWRWPELWGMNKAEIANPHLIYPGQVLMLVRRDGRAQLQLATAQTPGGDAGVVKLSPSVRSSRADDSAIPPIPLELIEPFLTQAVVFDTDALAKAPRIVATPESRTVLGKGDLAYARGDFGGASDLRIFREAKPIVDPSSKKVLGYEAAYVGAADLIREGETRKEGGDDVIIPATIKIRSARLEAGVGDRIAPMPASEFVHYVPHAPALPISGQIASVYGESIRAGQNNVVVINRGADEGVERGDVLALWKDGRRTVDETGDKKVDIKLPDERSGMLFVFQVYKHVSYALILSAYDAIEIGDRFTQP